jgi:hypothetical protein
MHDARNSYAQYVPIGYRLLGRYWDKACNSVPGGVGFVPPHGISNRGPTSEAVDCLHLPDKLYTSETN